MKTRRGFIKGFVAAIGALFGLSRVESVEWSDKGILWHATHPAKEKTLFQDGDVYGELLAFEELKLRRPPETIHPEKCVCYYCNHVKRTRP